MFMLPPPPNASPVVVTAPSARVPSGTEYVASTHWNYFFQTTSTIRPAKVSK